MSERPFEKPVPTFKTNAERSEWLHHELPGQLTAIHGYLSILHTAHPVLGKFFEDTRSNAPNRDLIAKARIARDFSEKQDDLVRLRHADVHIRSEFGNLEKKVNADGELALLSEFYHELGKHPQFYSAQWLLERHPAIAIHINIFENFPQLRKLQASLRKQAGVRAAKEKLESRPDYLGAMGHFESLFKERIAAQRIEEKMMKILGALARNLPDTAEANERLARVQDSISLKADELNASIERINERLKDLGDGAGPAHPTEFSEMLDTTANICHTIHSTVRATKELGHRQFNLAPLIARLPATHFNPPKSALRARPVWIRGNPDQLISVFTTMLANARRFERPEAGRFQLVTLEDHPDSVHLHLLDRGEGIPPHVIERFHRGERVTTREDGNGGMGLDVARRVITDHGGTIRLASEPGQYSNIHIVLPKSPRRE